MVGEEFASPLDVRVQEETQGLGNVDGEPMGDTRLNGSSAKNSALHGESPVARVGLAESLPEAGNLLEAANKPAPGLRLASADEPASEVNETKRPAQAPREKIHVHVIDIFTPKADDGLFNHGETTSRKIEMGGANPALAGRVVAHRYNVGFPEGDLLVQTDAWAGKIAAVLALIVKTARKNPEMVDAVNISLQDFDETPNARRVRRHINELLLMGIPVVLAAGNLGPQVLNRLTTQGTFNVKATCQGWIRPESGPGNVQAEGGSTSFAATAVSPVLGMLRAEGKTLAEMRETIAQIQTACGGTLPASPGGPVYGERPAELRPMSVVRIGANGCVAMP